uniref:Uncharacterized protein n=1 Tax=Rhizophora mucronata TaxID=61149 RepID=A0A2P2PDE9_RHIMU
MHKKNKTNLFILMKHGMHKLDYKKDIMLHPELLAIMMDFL